MQPDTGPAIPADIGAIDDAWLSSAMSQPVRIREVADIGSSVGMIGAIYRLSIEGADPASVVVKLPGLNETARFTAQVLSLNIREVGFYRELAVESPIRAPACHFAAVDPETHNFVLVLEDLGSLRTVDQIGGMGEADARRAATEIAAWHARWWQATTPIVERGTAVAVSDPIYPMLLPSVFTQGWDKVRAEMSVPPSVQTAAGRWVEALPRLLESLATPPQTLSHGDYRSDNMFFDDDDRLVLIDFQVLGECTPVADLAYFVTSSLSVETASAIEGELYQCWREALARHGIGESQTDGSWDRYRDTALFCLSYPMVAATGMNLSDERQRGLLSSYFERFERATDELNLPDLL